MRKLISIIIALVMITSLAVSSSAYALNYDAEIQTESTTNSIDIFSMNAVGQIATLSFDIPVYGLYGFEPDGFRLSLPADILTINAIEPALVYYVTANDKILLAKFNDPAGYSEPSTVDTEIHFGLFTHDVIYDENGNIVEYATVPPLGDGTFGSATSMRIVIEYPNYSWSDSDLQRIEALFGENGDYAYLSYCTALTYNAETGDYEEVPNSISYSKNWSRTAETEENLSYDFVTDPSYLYDDYVISNPLTWDHTLQARDNVNNADLVEVTVKLSEPIVGKATYSLLIDTPSQAPDLWWMYSKYEETIATTTVDGSCNELVFTITGEQIKEAYSKGSSLNFIIIENIELFDTSVMADFMHIDRNKVGEGSSSRGAISWLADSDRAYYNGMPINYAAGGAADSNGASVQAAKAYMTLTVYDEPVPVDLASLMGATKDDVIAALRKALPRNTVSEDDFAYYHNREYYSVNIYDPYTGDKKFVLNVGIGNFPSDSYCCNISTSFDSGVDPDFIKEHPELCSIDGVPIGLTPSELQSKFMPLGNNDSYFDTDKRESYSYSSWEDNGQRGAICQINKVLPNNIDSITIVYEYNNLRMIDGEEVYLSDEEYAASMPTSFYVYFRDISHLPDLTNVENISLIGKTVDEAKAELDSICDGLAYSIWPIYMEVTSDQANIELLSCNIDDGVISLFGFKSKKPPKNIEGMPSVVTQQEIDEMLQDESLNPRRYEIADYNSSRTKYSYEFSIGEITYLYREDYYSNWLPELDGTYYLTVYKRDYTPADVNDDGEVNLDDAVLALQKAMKVDVTSTVFIDEAADVNGDGEINLDDAVEILKIAMKVEQ